MKKSHLWFAAVSLLGLLVFALGAPIPGGIIVTGLLHPSDDTDTYPVTDPWWQLGGWRTATNTTQRDAIPAARRVRGMVVNVPGTGDFELGADLTTWTLRSAGGGGVSSVGASAPLASSGGATPTISMQAGSTSGHVLTWNGSAWGGAALPSSVTSVAASAPLASSGGATPTISLQSGSTSGHVLTWNGSAWAGAAPADSPNLATANLTLTANRSHNGASFNLGFTNLTAFDVLNTRGINLIATNRIQIVANDPDDLELEKIEVLAQGDLELLGATGLLIRTPAVEAATATTRQILTLSNPVTGLAEWGSLTFPTSQFFTSASGVDRTIYLISSALVATPSYAASITTDAGSGNHFRVTLTGNLTLANPINAVDGQRVTWELIQDGTGGRTLTLGNKFAFGDTVTDAVLSTAANKRDFLTAIYNSTADKWFVVGFGRGY